MTTGVKLVLVIKVHRGVWSNFTKGIGGETGNESGITEGEHV